jgi:hypothetical protein
MDTQKPDKSLYHKAAEICLYAPILNIIIFYFTKNEKNSVESINNAIFFITMAFYLIGFVSGIISLFGIKQYGTKGILKKSLLGLSITGIIFAIAIPNIIQYRSKTNQEALQLTELKKKAFEEIAKGGNQSEKTEKYIKESNKFLTNQAEKFSGEERLAMEVILKLNATIREKAEDFNTKMSAINESFWDYSQLKTDIDYQKRYRIIDSAHQAATGIAQFYSDIENNIDSMFKDININDDTKQKAKNGYLSTFNRNSDKVIRLYDINAQQLIQTKKIIKFLYEKKDSWNFENNNIVFDEESLSQEFNSGLSTLDQMDQEKKEIFKSITN